MEPNVGSDSDKTLATNSALKELEQQARIKFREKKFREIFSPLEGYILQLQSLLVWEKPRRSVLMFIVVNVIFWFASTTKFRIVFLAAVSAIIYVCVETIYSRVWPEIRVPRTEPEEEGWTPVHPNLLSLPELCEYLGKIWVWLEDWWARVWQLRQLQPAKFCLYVCCTCLILAGIGQQISGLILTYLILMGLLVWPSLEYNQVTKQLLEKVKPLFKQFEQSVEQTTYQARRQKRAKRVNKSYVAARRELLGESDSELEEFCPTPNPACDAALAQAATMMPSVGSLRATPITMFSVGVMPRGLSIDDDGHTDTEGNSLMAGLSSMPAYDDLDHSADELDIELPRDSNNSSMRETPPPRLTSSPPPRLTSSPPDKIKFVSTHFEESSSDEEIGLPRDVGIPNYDTFDKRGRDRMHSSDDMSLPPAAAQLLTNTVTSVIQDAMLTMGQQLIQDSVQESQDIRSPSDSDISHEAVPSVRRRKPQESKPKADPPSQDCKPRLAPSDSAELVEQFEVLDQSELDNEPAAENLNQSGSSDAGSISRLSDYGIGLINSWWPGKK